MISQNTDKDYLKSHIRELREKSESSGIYRYTQFLSPEEAVYAVSLGGFPYGGANDCERVVVRFGDPEDVGYEEDFPIKILRISPEGGKFSDKPGHRDFLGALMNLGIERSVMGDIMVKDGCGYVFVLDRIAPFIKDNLTRVRHGTVYISQLDELPPEIEPKREEALINVASNRLDAFVPRIFGIPRTKIKPLFSEGRILVNGRPASSGARLLREGDKVTARGYGRFIYKGIVKETKKKREVHLIEKYV